MNYKNCLTDTENAKIKLHWHRSVNFGDKLAPYILEKATGAETEHIAHKNEEDESISLVGSILSCPAISNSIVFGCGFASENDTVWKPKDAVMVRGYRSFKKLNGAFHYTLTHAEVGEPSFYLPEIFKPSTEKYFKLGIIPHLVDLKRVQNTYGKDDVLIINLKDDIETVIDQINQCENIISSSLHGLIVSDVYNIPNAWLEMSENVIGDGYKYLDYYSGIEYFEEAKRKRKYLERKIQVDDLIEMCELHDTEKYRKTSIEVIDNLINDLKELWQ